MAQAQAEPNSAEALWDHHGVWGEHPNWPVVDWQREVEEVDTRQGY